EFGLLWRMRHPHQRCVVRQNPRPVGALGMCRSDGVIWAGRLFQAILSFFMAQSPFLQELGCETKRASSRWLKTQPWQRGPLAWQAGFGPFCIGQSAVEEVRRYIEDQEAHHRRVSFQDEFRTFLTRYAIEDDERHVWD